MTAILCRSEYRNTRNTCTISVEKYFNKFSVPMWRITYKYDFMPYGAIFSDMLASKPRKSRIDHICACL